MAFVHSPKIVTDGLVLALDAGNVKSYPGSGTTWLDKSGRGNNGTLINGPTFNSGNGGSIVFDGVNDYVITQNYNEDSNLTLSVFTWVKLRTQNKLFGTRYLNWIINKRDNSSDRQWQLITRRVTDGDNRTYFGIDLFNGSTIICAINEGSTYEVELNKWYYVGFTTLGTNGSIAKTYQNGLLNNTNTLSADRGTGSRPIAIGTPGWDLGGSLIWDGNIALTQIYNRALSADEVLQNYNATKGRFGL